MLSDKELEHDTRFYQRGLCSRREGNTRRAIDLHEGDEIDADAFRTLIRAAVALNDCGGRRRTKRPS